MLTFWQRLPWSCCEISRGPWWRHQMETFSALLALFSGNYSPHKGQWRRALMFYLIRTWINGWVNNRKAGDLRRNRVHYDVNVMVRWDAVLVHGAPLHGGCYDTFLCISHCHITSFMIPAWLRKIPSANYAGLHQKHLMYVLGKMVGSKSWQILSTTQPFNFPFSNTVDSR